MTDYQVIVLVCVAGVLGECLRPVRPGQVLFAPDLLGRYGCRNTVLVASLRRVDLHLVSPLNPGPVFVTDGLMTVAGDPVQAFDAAAARAEAARVAAAVRWLVPVQQLVLIWLVVVVPLVLLAGVVPRGYLVLGGSLVLLESLLLGTYAAAHAALAAGSRGQAAQHMLVMLLFPPAGVRAADKLAGPRLAAVHPLAAALALSPEAEVRRIAAHWLRRWRHPLAGEPPCDRAWSAAAELLLQEGWQPEDLLRAPHPHGPGSLAFCPRCLAQFVVATGDCPDCPGVGKAPFVRGERARRPG